MSLRSSRHPEVRFATSHLRLRSRGLRSGGIDALSAAVLFAALPLAALTLLACAPSALPDPRLAAQRWADALQAGDEATVYSLLTDEARRAHGRDGVARLLSADRRELVALGRATTAPAAVLETRADVAFGADRTAHVVLEEGRYRVAAAGALPAGAQSPRDALRELRDVLAHRSFAGLLRVMTRESAQTLDGGLTDLVDALAEPSTLKVDVEGRRATAQLPGGHTVTLEREAGIWRVKEFD
jgi:hypothetical protein